MVAFLIPLCGNSENIAFWIQVSILYVKAKSYLLSFGTTFPLSMAAVVQEMMMWVHSVHWSWMTSSEEHSVLLH